ncbi:serine threonine isoform A, partial [Haematococcus lacustris]
PGGEAVVLGLDPVGSEGAGGELGGGPAASAPAVGGLPPAGAAGGADLDRGDMEEDDMDPRTLEAAAARLAQYTSDQPVGNLPLQQWADIYKETGAEEVCSDAGCDLVMQQEEWTQARER